MGDYAEDLDTLLSDECLAHISYLWLCELQAKECSHDECGEFEFSGWCRLYTDTATVITDQFGFNPRPVVQAYHES